MSANLQFSVATRAGVQIFDGLSSKKPIKSWDTADECIWSKDGTKLIVLKKDEPNVATVIDAANGYAVYKKLEYHLEVRRAYFSPKGAYAVTYHRPKDEFKNEDNLVMWKLSTGEQMFKCYIKSLTPGDWHPLKWTDKEKYCCKLVNNEVQIFDGSNVSFYAIKAKIHMQNVSMFELGPEDSGFIACMAPESKSMPAVVKIYNFKNPETVCAQKSFFKAQEVKIKWNFDGSACLIKTSVEVDKSGGTYYGSSCLYYMRSDGSLDMVVISSDQGPVEDFSWSPTGHEFVLISGAVPAEISLWDGRKCEKKIVVGKAHRNNIRWNPFGRFFCLGGYGNLAGDTDFWDKNRKTPLGSVNAQFTVECDWAPDGRHFMMSSTFPRRKVDNNIKIYYYDATLIHTLSFNELYYANWRPAPGLFEDRPATPSRVKKGPAAAEAPAKPAAYRPPGSTGALAALLRADRGVGEATRAKRIQTPLERLPPGAAPTKPKRVRKKKDKTNANENDADDKSEDEQAAPPAPVAEPVAGPSVPVKEAVEEAMPDTVEGIEKKMKNINKKLREIDELKAKPEKQGLPEVKEKISREASLKDQLKELQTALTILQRGEGAEEVEKKAKAIGKKLRDIAKLKEKDYAQLPDEAKAKVDSEASLQQQLAALEKQLAKMGVK